MRKPSILDNIFSKISPYANYEKNIDNTKTNILNKMFILFDDQDQIKLFSNIGEYEIHHFDSNSNSIKFIEYKISILNQEKSRQENKSMEEEFVDENQTFES